ncbi:hypothetical protein [Teredinibacter haidensis]|uniref:hypothetical protein n=1 Tax=Teredinibacter haidensis TaxID=2731755 RepID=UPI001FE86F5F|nr:hypothetical protein [Teredinibacter haidensis]
MKKNIKVKRSPQQQQGVATILVILLITLAMTVSAIGVVYSLRGNQELQMAAHANTRAQASAWTGVEIFRNYLFQLSNDITALGTLAGTLPITVETMANTTLSAEIVDITAPATQNADDIYLITVNIRAEDAAAQSSSVVQVVYQVSPFLCGGNGELTSTLDFHRDLSLGGDISILSDNNTASTFYVDGAVNLSNVSANGVSALYATGDINIGSSAYVPEVHSNGNIRLYGGSSVGIVKAVGSVTTEGGASITGSAYANDEIILGGSSVGKIYSRSYVNRTGWAATGDINAGDYVTINGGPISNIAAVGNVTINASTNVGEIVSEGDIQCPYNSWNSFISLHAGGALNNCSTGDGVDSQASESVSVTTIDELQPFTMEPVMVDAWALKSQANYTFEIDDGKMRVTVQNINSVVNGVYYIGKKSGTNRDFLCEEVDGNSNCTAPTAPTLTICNGHSANNACFSYDSDTSTWGIDGKNMAPGVAWFEGNLLLGNGQYYNTFIATENISTSSAHKTYAVNYIGYEAVCTNSFPSNTSADFAGLYPTNYCDLNEGTLITNAVGNLSLLAGGYDPSDETTYVGGNISLGASTEIFGTVMSGDYLYTGGSTTVHGFITASGLGSSGEATGNTLGGSTTVDLQSLPVSYEPATIPNMAAGSCDNANTAVSWPLWSQYL